MQISSISFTIQVTAYNPPHEKNMSGIVIIISGKKNVAVIMQDFERLIGAMEVKHGVFRNSGSSTANELSSFGELLY